MLDKGLKSYIFKMADGGHLGFELILTFEGHKNPRNGFLIPENP